MADRKTESVKRVSGVIYALFIMITRLTDFPWGNFLSVNHCFCFGRCLARHVRVIRLLCAFSLPLLP
jgi:hypothetical protein